MMSNDNRPDDQREHFHEMLESFRAVVLITRTGADEEPKGSRHDAEVASRPMQVARLDDNCDLWFLTDADSAKVFEIRKDPQVHVVAQDSESRFVSLTGTARVLQDRAIITELFSEPYKVWFPDGPETPGIRAIHVSAEEGEFWDSQGKNKVKYLLQAAKAYATGSRPKTDTDQSAHVTL
ncbi:MAG TPA: pyridoxamine 5'-phosphate oxidase family protein [Gemmatimonas sp.]|nr:pyridoxamine 5'-phosphate oxidase family protein [Gemmatimonas sp.]